MSKDSVSVRKVMVVGYFGAVGSGQNACVVLLCAVHSNLQLRLPSMVNYKAGKRHSCFHNYVRALIVSNYCKVCSRLCGRYTYKSEDDLG